MKNKQIKKSDLPYISLNKVLYETIKLAYLEERNKDKKIDMKGV